MPAWMGWDAACCKGGSQWLLPQEPWHKQSKTMLKYRVFEHSLRMPKIPPIFIWQRKGHCRNRPQTIDHNLQEAPPECTKTSPGNANAAAVLQLQCGLQARATNVCQWHFKLSYSASPRADTPHVRHAVFATQAEHAQLDQAQHLNVTAFRFCQIAQHTETDDVLQELKSVILDGWPDFKEDTPLACAGLLALPGWAERAKWCAIQGTVHYHPKGPESRATQVYTL